MSLISDVVDQLIIVAASPARPELKMTVGDPPDPGKGGATGGGGGGRGVVDESSLLRHGGGGGGGGGGACGVGAGPLDTEEKKETQCQCLSGGVPAHILPCDSPVIGIGGGGGGGGGAGNPEAPPTTGPMW